MADFVVVVAAELRACTATMLRRLTIRAGGSNSFDKFCREIDRLTR